jgi:ABC-type nitrate/sulfonate/bicarbonate transport system permease component
MLPWLGVATVLALFELLTRTEVISSRHFPPPTDMFSALADQVTTTAFWTAVGDTMQGWALGLLVAAVIAIPCGIFIGSSALLYRSVRAVVEFLRPIPSVALIPLAILIWGSGLESKVFLAAFASTWPLLMQTLYGVQDVDPVATDTARSFGFTRSERFFHVTLPSAGPYIATGIRISAAVSLILAVTAELVIGSPGLGQQINIARQSENPDVMYALIAVTGLLGWGVNVVFTQLEKRALFWHPSQRAEAAR